MDYRFHKVPRYSELKAKLMMILSDNKNLATFSYLGTKNGHKLGILVKGTDNDGVRDFLRFFSINDIEHYFNKSYKNKSL